MNRLVASFFGAGLILRRIRGSDLGSGTVGSLFALPIAVWLQPRGVAVQLAVLAAVVAAALIAVRPFSAEEGDPGWVVIDEVAGTFVATLGLGPVPAVVAWLVFRAADIWKDVFFGVGIAERRLPGAVGVVADDLVAGLYGLAAGWAVHSLIGPG